MKKNNKRPTRLTAEMIVGTSAVFIGVCALAVSMYETSLMRWEQRAAVLPLLELGRSYYSSGDHDSNEEMWRLSLHAENVGIGPARIENFLVQVDGIPVRTWNSALHALTGVEDDIAFGQSTINGRTIPPDRKVTMIDLRDASVAAMVFGEFSRMTFEACFCSIFEECWTTSNVTFGTAQSVESCPESENSFLE